MINAFVVAGDYVEMQCDSSNIRCVLLLLLLLLLKLKIKDPQCT